MKIGIDLDDVTVNFVELMVEYYNKKNKTNLKKHDHKTYQLWEVWNCTREESIIIVDEFQNSEVYETIQPIENSIESINTLSKTNEIYFITSRKKEFQQQTEKWIKKYFPTTHVKIIHTGDFHKPNGNTKAEVCQQLKIDFMIEDNEKYAQEIADKGINLLLFDQPWNQKLKDTKKIRRVKNWKQILEILKT